jgi:hypothetical protein
LTIKELYGTLDDHMLDSLVGQTFEAKPGDRSTRRFMVTAVKGQMASVVDAENHESEVSIWSLLHGLYTAAIRPERPGQDPDRGLPLP